jgi:hypothetical protein|tara:strand:+ start:487 stop:1185 length:699 start_codon:yes stop_codon:yes gene_type:complete
MARISSYGVDSTPLNSDKMLGTNPDGTVKNFTLGAIAKHYSYTNAIGITGQITYVFQNNEWNPATSGSMHISTSNVNTAFSTITTLKLSKFQYSGSNSLANFYSEFLNKDILVADIENQNNYGVYTCTAVVQDSTNTDFYDLTLTYRSGNGNITNDYNYTVVLFAGAQDKDFTFTQSNGSATWTINHNLNKFPSVMIKLSSGIEGIADVEHQDKNNLTISFRVAESGTAHLN